MLFFLSWPVQAQTGPEKTNGPDFAPGEVVVSLQRSESVRTLDALGHKHGVTPIRNFPSINACLMRLDKKGDVAKLCQDLEKEPGVRFVEPNYSRRALLAAPNDPAYNNLDTLIAPFDPEEAEPTWFQWGLHLIQALEAWGVYPNTYYTAATKPADGVKIAVIDTGIDIGGVDATPQPDFINAGGSSPDAAEGGQVDLADGRNVLSGYDPTDFADDYGHGTAVAGVIGASTNNGGTGQGDGIAGLAYPCQIMPIKAMDDTGYGTEADLTAAILWAVDHGALIINISAGGTDYSQLEQDAVDYAWEHGSLIVAAAGNEGDSFNRPHYPAACAGVLAVAATTWPEDYPATYSNYGDYVGISAPGGDVSYIPLAFWGTWTTMPTEPVPMHDAGWEPGLHTYQYHFGTSLACPFVAGLAGLYAASKGITQSTPDGIMQIWRALQQGCDNAGGTTGWNPYWGWGRINAYQTLLDQDHRGSDFGCLTGQVTYYGTVVENAVVEATPVGGGSSTSATTHADGTYRLANLDPGLYHVRATYFGETGTVTNVLVEASMDRPRVNFHLPYPSFQPDLWIKQGASWRGEDVYNDDGTDQTGTQTVGVETTAVYQARLYNDGNETETFWITGTAGDGNWTVRYYWGWGNQVDPDHEVTDRVTSSRGWVRPNVVPDGQRAFLITVTPNPGVTGSFEVLVTARSDRDESQRDTLKAVTTVPHLQPDLWIKQGANWLGDNVYNDDGTDQTGRRGVLAGDTAIYQARLYNDGDETETFFITGPAGEADWTVRYYYGNAVDPGREVTDQVTSEEGWKRPNVPPGGQRAFLIAVTPSSALASGRLVALVNARSRRDPNQQDTLKTITRVK